MNWDAKIEARLGELRLRELAGELSEDEHAELATLLSVIEADEIKLLEQTIIKMSAEQEALRKKLRKLQNDNIDLATLLAQQEQLIADTRKWLAEFESRHLLIRQSYKQLTGNSVALA